MSIEFGIEKTQAEMRGPTLRGLPRGKTRLTTGWFAGWLLQRMPALSVSASLGAGRLWGAVPEHLATSGVGLTIHSCDGISVCLVLAPCHLVQVRRPQPPTYPQRAVIESSCMR